MILCCYENILEGSAVALSVGAEEEGFPLYRLWDRSAGRQFKAASASDITIGIGSGSALMADRLLIPPGHGLDGASLRLEGSEDGATYSQLVPDWAQSGGGLIERHFPLISYRHWRFSVLSPASPPALSELFISRAYEWEKDPEAPLGPIGTDFNVERDETASGEARYLIKGPPRRTRSYSLRGAWEAQKKSVSALVDAWAGSRPFFLRDHDGEWMFVELSGPVGFKKTGYGEYSFKLDFREVI